MAIGLITPMDNTRHEDVVDLITNVTYKSTPLISRIGEGLAMNTLHEWLIDEYDAAGDDAFIEASDATTTDLTAPGRPNNIVQMFRKVVVVSDTEVAIPHYGANDPFEYQVQKKLVGIARDMELAYIQGTRASGSSGVARRSDGVIALITTNKTTVASGTTFVETELGLKLQMVYNSGTDEEVDLILTSSYIKLIIDKFATSVTRYIDAEEFKQVLRVDVYESSFGQHEIVMERNVPTGSANNGSIIGLDTSKFRNDYLINRRVALRPLAKTGSATKGMLEGESTIAALNEQSSLYATGYND
jgi:hypothetical protein